MSIGRQGSSWRDVREIGNGLGIRLLALLVRCLGRRAVRLVLYPIALYYLLKNRAARRASREYLQRVLGTSRVSWRRIYRHMLCFAHCTLDRYLFVAGRGNEIEVAIHGHHHLEAACREGRGALLLGAHVGSFEAMRAASAERDVKIAFVADFRGSRMISELLERLDPSLRHNVIASGDSLAMVLQIKERIEARGVVALLADRVDNAKRSLPSNFLGEAARFPTGPYMVAAALHCPVLLAFGIHTPPNRYDVYCEPFADRITLPKRQRNQALAEIVQQYATRLEHYCKMAPDNWFNFFPFWDGPSS